MQTRDSFGIFLHFQRICNYALYVFISAFVSSLTTILTVCAQTVMSEVYDL